MLKLYGSLNSSAGRCLWLLEELGVEYEQVALDFKAGEHKNPEYLKINPNGKVPTLVHDDFVLWETLAINRYLAKTFAPNLLGQNLADSALIDQWSLWSVLHLYLPFSVAMYFAWFKIGEAESVEKAKTIDAPPLLKILDDYLAGKEFMVGGQFSVADINVASIVNLGARLEFDLSGFSNITSWLTKMREREAYQKAALKK